MDETRPNPDTLLAELQSGEEKAARGKLRIYFGASAGVGKTYAMLSAAKVARAEGIDVVVGLVETHGRAETAALVEGLEHLPPRQVEYRGRTLPEFDLDAALARKPALILVDESRIPTWPARVTPSAGRTSKTCSPPGSTCGPRSTCSISTA